MLIYVFSFSFVIYHHNYPKTHIRNEEKYYPEKIFHVFFPFQVKGLSIEHEKLAVTQRHATTESNKSSTTESTASTSNGSGVVISNGDRASSERSGISCSGGINSLGNEVGGCASAERDAINVTEAAEAPENGLARGIKRRTPTPAPLSPPSNYAMPNMTYSAAHYYDSPQKRIMRHDNDYTLIHLASWSKNIMLFSCTKIQIFL